MATWVFRDEKVKKTVVFCNFAVLDKSLTITLIELTMKKTRFLIALLVMLVAASSYAQDSYRKAVKDYLTAVNQFEKEKAYISTMSMVFDRDGKVDIDQLTQRYLDERYENDMIDFYVTTWKEQGMTEAELSELSSLLTTPEFKAFTAHNQNWMKEYASYMLTPFLEHMKVMQEPMESGEYLDKVKDYVSFLDSPVQPRPEIDAAYADKFNHVMLESPSIKLMMEMMLKRFDENKFSDDPDFPKPDNKVKDWMTKNVPVLLLNFAYDNLTLEDLDYAAKLYDNKTYNKFQSFDLNSIDMEKLYNNHAYFKYLNWMKEQGAKTSEDPNAVMGYFKSMLESFNSSK